MVALCDILRDDEERERDKPNMENAEHIEIYVGTEGFFINVECRYVPVIQTYRAIFRTDTIHLGSKNRETG